MGLHSGEDHVEPLVFGEFGDDRGDLEGILPPVPARISTASKPA
jgi:hypothetical protein